MITKLNSMKFAVLAAGAACLLSLPAAHVSAQPLTLNGEQNTFVNQGVLIYQPAPIYVGHGSGTDAANTVVSQVNTSFLTGGPAYVAYSDGSGQHNTVVWNLDGDSFVQMGFDVNGLANVLGYDGSVTINIDGHSAPNGGLLNPEPLTGAWGNLRTERVTLAAREGSSATINLTGPHANWYAWTRHIDMGPMGRAEVNIREGAGLVEAQRIAVGGSRWGLTSTDATTGDLIFPDGFGGEGYLTLDGAGSLIQFADNNNGWLRIGRHAKGEVIVSNGAVVDGATDTAAIQLWVGEQPNGDGKLTIETGGIVNMSGVLRINSVGSDDSYVLVDGPGSELNINARSGTTSYIGNTGDNPGSKGVLDIVNGGSASFRSNDVNSRLRLGNQAGAIGEVNVDGSGSIMEIGDYVQIGYNGTGTLNLTNNARLIVGDEGGGASSVGRQPGGLDQPVGGVGSFLVDASHATFGNGLWVAAGSNNFNDSGTGIALVEVKDGGLIEVGALLNVRGSDYQVSTTVEEEGEEPVVIVTDHRSEGTVLLDNGTIRMTGTDPMTVVGEYATLTGEGVIEGDLVIANDAIVAGTGAGITLTGVLSGTGAVENLTVGGVRASTDMGPLVLNNVRFGPDAVVNAAITDLSEVTGLLAYDSNTSVAETHLEVTMETVIIDPNWTARILPAGVNHEFASVTVPEGFLLQDGLLSVDGDGPPPPPPAVISEWVPTGTSSNWRTSGNWSADGWPDDPLTVAWFGSVYNDGGMVGDVPTTTLTVNMNAADLAQEVAAIVLGSDNTVDRRIRNNGANSIAGYMTIYGADLEIEGRTFENLLVGNFSQSNSIRFYSNASSQLNNVRFMRSGVIHVEHPDAMIRSTSRIYEPEGTSVSLTKTGAGILNIGIDYGTTNDDRVSITGDMILEEGIIHNTYSGGVSNGQISSSPYGFGNLVLRGGSLRSSSTGARTIYNNVILDGTVGFGSPDSDFNGNQTVSANGGSKTTLASDSTVVIHNTTTWAQVIEGEFNLTKQGPGTLVFGGSGTHAGGSVNHTGTTTVSEGMLRLNTTIDNSDVFVQNGGSLGFGQSSTVGRGKINSDLTLRAGGNLVFRLNGTDAYDSVETYGGINLNGGELVLELGYQPQIGDTFILVANWGWQVPNGTLSYNGGPLIEGAQFQVESGEFSQWFEITYEGSGGHDLVIEAIEEGAPPSGGYSDWASGYGLTGADAAPDANPAGDGFTNLQKFAFGLNPTVPTASLANVSRDGDLLVLRWNQLSGSGIDYGVEASATLASDSWTEIPGAEPEVMSVPDVTPPAGYERVEWTIDVSAEGVRSFYRASALVDSNLLP